MDLMKSLLSELHSQRRHIVEMLSQLTQSQLSTPVPPTTWAPIAVMHHLALDVERWWFPGVVAGEAEAWAYFEKNPGGAWSVPPGTDVFALYEAECARSDEIIARSELSDVAATWPEYLGPPQTVLEIVLHVITETATHAGQLDVVRESIDGKTWLVLD